MCFTSSEKSSAICLNHCSRSILMIAGFLLSQLFLAAWSPVPGAAEPLVCKKQIPKFTLKTLSPPYKNYDYFQYRDAFPFEYKASKFSLVNAWWLAEASALVYADEAYVKKIKIDREPPQETFFHAGGDRW